MAKISDASDRLGPSASSTGQGGVTGTQRVYWDAAQSAPPCAEASQAFLAALADGWADPRRLHTEGRRCALLLDGARQAVAAALAVPEQAVAFTGSFTAAAHAALLGTAAGRRRVGDAVVCSAVEHSAVLAAADFHAAGGGRAVQVGVDRVGRVDPDELRATVAGPGVALAAVQLANGEVGTRQPVEEVAAACRDADVPLVMDVSQSLGHSPVPAGVGQVLVADPRSWGGVPGVGVLVVRPGVRWRSVAPEDPEVPADRPGVPGGVSVPAALAAAVSLQVALADRQADQRRRDVIDLLRRRLPQVAPDLELVGDPVDRLPHLLTFSALFVDGEALSTELDRAGFAVGSGSACTAATLRPSHVLAAMDVLTQGNVRIGLPRTTPEAELAEQADRFLTVFPRALAAVRERLGTAGL